STTPTTMTPTTTEPTPTPTPSTTPTIAPSGSGTGQFSVRGTQIIDPNGNVFVPHGINVLGPDSWWPTATAGLSGVAQTWGFNTIRLNSCLPVGCDGTGYDW